MIETFVTNEGSNLINILITLIGYLMPIPLAILALKLWSHYKKETTALEAKWTLLEIQIPREIAKSPSAMELFFSNTFDPKLWFSLEMVSIDGRVHFYIRTQNNIKDLVQTQIYAQYPQAKVVEIEDYVFDIPKYDKNGDWYVWGCEYSKKKDDFLPLKTYKAYGEEMRAGTKEEFKVDPITPIIELLGSLSKGQQLWIQILAKHSGKKYYSKKKEKKVEFSEAAPEFLLELLKPYTKVQKNEKGETDLDIRTPKTIEPVVKAVSEQLGQLHFECGIRVIALSDKKIITEDQFNGLSRSAKLIFRQFTLANSNELERINTTEFEDAWKDPIGTTMNKFKRRLLDSYRLRMFFHPPMILDLEFPKWLKIFAPTGKPKVFVLSSEELASIFHFPGMVSETPSFKRVETKIAKPPSNLPI
ncbi:MAG: hypothetical protein EOM85_00270 [Candidatus Moranbacteria bacterium]|nr:hypothetical protein [Candidatus Moranbacteria bacterium]